MQSDGDIVLVKDLPAKEKEKKHCIIKCTPRIRQAIADRRDKLYTRYENCKIYDSYYPHQCFKCQGFGHNSENCREVNETCAKCTGNHRTKDCKPENIITCINCKKKGNTETNHTAYSVKCPVYKEQQAKVRNNTDHGCA